MRASSGFDHIVDIDIINDLTATHDHCHDHLIFILPYRNFALNFISWKEYRVIENVAFGNGSAVIQIREFQFTAEQKRTAGEISAKGEKRSKHTADIKERGKEQVRG